MEFLYSKTLDLNGSGLAHTLYISAKERIRYNNWIYDLHTLSL